MNDTPQEEPKGNKAKKASKFRIPWPSLEQASAIAKLLFQLVATTGGLLLLIYCVEAGHYPTGATIGDVLLLLATSIAATTVYLILVGILYQTGLVVAQPFRLLLNRQSISKHSDQAKEIDGGEKTPPVRRIPAFDVVDWLLSGAAILLVALAALRFRTKPEALISLAYCIVVVGILRITLAVIGLAKNQDRRSKRDARIVIALAIFLAPIYTGLVRQLDILPASLRAIGVRKENVTIFVVKQRALMIDDELQPSKPTKIIGDYYKYENASVLMRGIGSESVVEIGNRRWIIPNDQFVIAYPGRTETGSSSPKG